MRADALRASVARHLADAVTLDPMLAGTHTLGWLAKGMPSATLIARRASEEGMVLFPASRYCLEPPQRDALVIGDGGLTPQRIDAGVRRLAAIIRGARSL